MRMSSAVLELLGGVMLLLVLLPGPGVATITFERAYGGRLVDAAADVQQTSDGGYIVAGFGDWNTFTNVMYVYLIKTDSLGDTIWTRTYGSDSCQNLGWSVQQTFDGGYIVAGHMNGVKGLPPHDWYIIKTDAFGDTVWTRMYGFERTDLPHSIQQMQDGGYIVTGIVRLPGRPEGGR